MKKRTSVCLLGGVAVAIAVMIAPWAAAQNPDTENPRPGPESGHYMTPHGPNPNVFYGPNPFVMPGATLPY